MGKKGRNGLYLPLKILAEEIPFRYYMTPPQNLKTKNY